MIRKMSDVDVKEALKVIYKKIEVACEKRKPVSFIFIILGLTTNYWFEDDEICYTYIFVSNQQVFVV